jgi:hypothetical protein
VGAWRILSRRRQDRQGYGEAVDRSDFAIFAAWGNRGAHPDLGIIRRRPGGDWATGPDFVIGGLRISPIHPVLPPGWGPSLHSPETDVCPENPGTPGLMRRKVEGLACVLPFPSTLPRLCARHQNGVRSTPYRCRPASGRSILRSPALSPSASVVKENLYQAVTLRGGRSVACPSSLVIRLRAPGAKERVG